ncbi:MAG: helix-turn-helix domain-containing protein [Alphaproteobacteria bacterium]|nr:helix-turn-helix domain-containing protein [Alphaproteobacteria bacterium]
MNTSETLRLGFLMFPGFPMACLTSAIEPLRAANEISGAKIFSWKLVAESLGPVRSSADVRFEPDVSLSQVDALHHLYLIAPPNAAYADPKGSPARLRWLERKGMVLGAFSGGIFPLARAGVMAGHKCSVHWCYEAAFKAEFPKVEASEVVILREKQRTTASGAGAVFDLMLHLIEERLGRDCMTEVACWFQHPFMRHEDAIQKVPVPKKAGTADRLPPAIREAIRLFENHVEDPLRIPDVASAIDMSGRHFERMFKRETGQSPLRFYRQLRLTKARQRVLYSDEPLREIAHSVGYLKSGPMARDYKELFGVSPKDERRLFIGLRDVGQEQAEDI